MRFPTALGGFLILAGLMVLVLRPVYHSGKATPTDVIETAGSPYESKPVPTWLGMAALVAGSALLVLTRPRRSHDK